ncbi:GNAT family N-acetyltransferase [Lentibacillus amyloliquefaciens]|uniref:Acetyltransferase n=1 Tax=Lentibacillus amyloliquefaciens TaxID=1472767 RepID=A0A0U4FMB6_9BACI|nr:GNAT family N-acetyltransferase [Lentibacillus amyloliquefaciens]ALX48884.1 acetyltransferase [Lentibacillus amyloliquefaciens]
MDIQTLQANDEAPIDLLLLADPSKEQVEKYLEQGQCYIAKEAENITAVYVLQPISPGIIELKNIAVGEAEQGKGIGKQLISHAIKTARFQGYHTIEVGTGNSSIGQLARYQKCGFRITEVDKDFFMKHYDEKIVENGIVCRDMIRLAMEL